MNNCPKCGSLLFAGDIVCKTCGEPVSNTSNVVSAPVVTPMDSVTPAIPEIPLAPVDTNIQAVASVPLEPLTYPAPLTNEVPNPSVSMDSSFQTVSPIPAVPVEASMAPIAPVMSGDSIAPVSPASPVVPETQIPIPMQANVNVPSPNLGSQVAPAVPIPTSNIGAKKPKRVKKQKAPKMLAPKIPLTEEQKWNRIFFWVVVVVTLIALGVMSYFMYQMFSGNNNPEETNIAENAKEYHYEGFDLYITDDLYAEVYDHEFYVGDISNSWSAIMTLEIGTYNTLVSNKQQLVDYFAEMGYEASDPVEKEISGTAFVTTEVMMGTKNVLVAYAKANGTKLFGIVLENESGEYTDADLKPIGTILSTMKYVGPTFELPDGFQLDLFKETFTVAE